MKKILMLCLIVLGIFLIPVSCKTSDDLINVKIVLPSYPETPLLTEDSKQNETELILHHYRWLLWASTARYLMNDLDKIDYDKTRETIQDIISLYDNVN